MSESATVADRLAAAVSLRETGRDREAKDLLLALSAESPEDAEVNLHCAWAHDKLGLEAEAVPYYEKALELGLGGTDLEDALLGLGSTYRALGRYGQSLDTLTRGVETFPDARGMQVFRAMALYNADQAKEACEILLTLLADTTSDETISRYRNAIATYAEDLDRTWS